MKLFLYLVDGMAVALRTMEWLLWKCRVIYVACWGPMLLQ